MFEPAFNKQSLKKTPLAATSPQPQVPSENAAISNESFARHIAPCDNFCLFVGMTA